MTTTPFFSVVMSTYGRGKHIKPSIESVLQQTHQDFEVLVVGDGCTDETQAVVSTYLSDRVAWFNREKRGGSQSFPNNLGIEKSRGQWIVYLGHDDIWSPRHLEALRALIEARRDLDFAVSGCLYYGPEDSGIYFVTGLFESDEAKFKHFFPPSSFSHRRDLVDRIGPWADPNTIVEAVDSNFMLRAARAGLQFASTNEITVHKFTAGHRYLSFHRQESQEQWAVMQEAPWNNPSRINELVESARQQGRYMTMIQPDHTRYQVGEIYAYHLRMKGAKLPELRPLSGKICIKQNDEPRAFDWYDLRKSRSFRWSGPNPRPRILIPYAYPGKARITLEVQRVAFTPLKEIRIEVNGALVSHKIRKDETGQRSVVVEAPLNRSDHTIITLHTPKMGKAKNGSARGIAIGDIFVEPVTWRHRVHAVWSGLMDLRNRSVSRKPAAKPPI